MLIQEILSRKIYLEKKLNDIDNYINKLSNLEIQDKGSLYNKALELKFDLLSKIRSHKVLLNDESRKTLIDIGGKSISVYEAVKIRDTLYKQLITLDDIITNGDFTSVDIFKLLDHRDSIFEEYELLNNAIKTSDATTEWLAEKGEK